MLTIVVPKSCKWDSKNERFIYTKETTLKLEHSLVAIAKWESIHEKSFLFTNKKQQLTNSEFYSYVKCMNMTQNVDDMVFHCLSTENISDIMKYINRKMTATTISNRGSKANNEIITAEILYYDMIELGIPIQFEKWHLNRLLTLIQVCNIKSSGSKKMSRNAALQYQSSINKSRLKNGRRG